MTDNPAGTPTVVITMPPELQADIAALGTILRTDDSLTFGFVPGESDPYDPTAYVVEKARFGSETSMLVDRNLVSRWCALARGETPTKAHQSAAAVLAFSQIGEILVEPNIAFYELAATSGNDHAMAELNLFRRVDNASPVDLVDIALGRPGAVRLPDEAPNQSIDFTMPLHRWRRNYVLALKAAELELDSGSAESRIVGLINWMFHDFLLGGPAIFMAALYFAPGSPRAGLLKGLRSHEREKAVMGVRNAAWDLTLLSAWLERLQPDDDYAMGSSVQLLILASLDRSVHRIARALTSSQEQEDGIFAQLAKWWPADTAARLDGLLKTCRSRSAAEFRQLNRDAPPGFVDDHISAGEAVLRSWRP